MSLKLAVSTFKTTQLSNLQRTGLVMMVRVTTCGIGTQDLQAFEPRTIDETNNNLHNLKWGRTNTPLLRIMNSDYTDEIHEPAGSKRLSARAISNMVATQDQLIHNSKRASDFVWQWGQFIDHDTDLTEEAHPAELYDIVTQTGDTHFAPHGTRTKIMAFTRSAYTDIPNYPRQQVNHITVFLDESWSVVQTQFVHMPSEPMMERVVLK